MTPGLRASLKCYIKQYTRMYAHFDMDFPTSIAKYCCGLQSFRRLSQKIVFYILAGMIC